MLAGDFLTHVGIFGKIPSNIMAVKKNKRDEGQGILILFVQHRNIL